MIRRCFHIHTCFGGLLSSLKVALYNGDSGVTLTSVICCRLHTGVVIFGLLMLNNV